MEDFSWRECDEEGTQGLLDVTVSERLNGHMDCDNLEGEVEWLVYYTRFLCEDTEANRKYLEEMEELDYELQEEEEEEE